MTQATTQKEITKEFIQKLLAELHLRPTPKDINTLYEQANDPEYPAKHWLGQTICDHFDIERRGNRAMLNSKVAAYLLATE